MSTIRANFNRLYLWHFQISIYLYLLFLGILAVLNTPPLLESLIYFNFCRLIQNLFQKSLLLLQLPLPRPVRWLTSHRHASASCNSNILLVHLPSLLLSSMFLLVVFLIIRIDFGGYLVSTEYHCRVVSQCIKKSLRSTRSFNSPVLQVV